MPTPNITCTHCFYHSYFQHLTVEKYQFRNIAYSIKIQFLQSCCLHLQCNYLNQQFQKIKNVPAIKKNKLKNSCSFPSISNFLLFNMTIASICYALYTFIAFLHQIFALPQS